MAAAARRQEEEPEPMPSDTADRVRKVVCEVLKVDPARVVPAARFTNDLGAESIDSVRLVAAFEEEFGIEMDEDAALGVKSVGAAVGFIEGYRK
jgi:acyl carrier protein